MLKPRNATKCANGGTSEATTVLKGQSINNDLLTCFFTNPNTNIADVISATYAGPPLISSDIYDSPRFGYVPVLKVQPANGGSKKYQIIDFRACFITDQAPSFVKGDGPGSASNGVTTDNNGVASVQVIFLNGNALPIPPVEERHRELRGLRTQGPDPGELTSSEAPPHPQPSSAAPLVRRGCRGRCVAVAVTAQPDV